MGAAGAPADFVTISPTGSSAITYLAYRYTGGAVNGSTTFNLFLTPGSYVARLYYNDTYTIQAESTPFMVTAISTTIVTNAGSYISGQPIQVSWMNSPGAPRDFVTLSLDGSPATSYATYAYTGGTVNGATTFTLSLAPGTYRARFYYDDTYAIVTESATFTVTP
jgi:hypothetical protein